MTRGPISLLFHILYMNLKWIDAQKSSQEEKEPRSAKHQYLLKGSPPLHGAMRLPNPVQSKRAQISSNESNWVQMSLNECKWA